MRVLIFITSYRQVKEFKYFVKFLENCPSLVECSDVYIHCNNCEVESELLEMYKLFPNKNKYLYITTKNEGFKMGGVEAVSDAFDRNIFKDYDYVIHLHPDVFITKDVAIMKILNENINNNTAFFITKSFPNDSYFFSFDFFIFKPKLLESNIFNDCIHECADIPEHYLCYIINKYKVPYIFINRFWDNNWQPRRIDEYLYLWHEHDLEKVERHLNSGKSTA